MQGAVLARVWKHWHYSRGHTEEAMAHQRTEHLRRWLGVATVESLLRIQRLHWLRRNYMHGPRHLWALILGRLNFEPE
eukprot:6260575-Alexandrium_andersonii.AAC.1